VRRLLRRGRSEDGSGMEWEEEVFADCGEGSEVEESAVLEGEHCESTRFADVVI
jgi:hypothetical protein